MSDPSNRAKLPSKRKKVTAAGTSRGAAASAPRAAAPRPPSPPAEHSFLTFGSPEHRGALERLRQRHFVESRYIDWEVLAEFGLEQEVRAMTSVGAWGTFFDIVEPAYEELTLEFLSTFYLDVYEYSWDASSMIQFRLACTPHMMSLTDFSQLLGLYTQEYTQTAEYQELLTALPPRVSEQNVWSTLSQDPQEYDTRRSKASHLRRPAWRVMHSVLAHSLSGRGNSHGVVNRQDILYLHSMVERRPIHLGHALAHFFRHQAQDGRVGVITVGPYITRLARRLGYLEQPAPGLQLACRMTPIRRENLRALGIGPAPRDQPEDMEHAEPEIPPESPPQFPALPPPSPPHEEQWDLRQQLEAQQRQIRRIERNVLRMMQHFGITPDPDSPPAPAPHPEE